MCVCVCSSFGVYSSVSSFCMTFCFCFYVLVERAHFPSLKRIGSVWESALCRLCIPVVLVCWKLSKWRWAFPSVVAARVWSQGQSTGGSLVGILDGYLWVLHWWGKGVWQVVSKLTLGLVPCESPVPTHMPMYALGQTAPENSCIRYPLGPTGVMESGFVHIPPWPLHALRCSWELQHWCLWSCWRLGSDIVHVHVFPWPMCTLGWCREFLLGSRIRQQSFSLSW